MNINSGQTATDKRKGELGSSQNLLLGVLAALIALLGYLYFFTGVIKERDVQQKSLPAAVQKVKQPIPPRPAGDEKIPAAPLPKHDNKPQTVSAPAVSLNTQAPPAPAVSPKAPATPSKPAAVQPKAPLQAAAKPDNQTNVLPVKPKDKIAATEKNAKQVAGIKPAPANDSKESRYRIVTADIFSSSKADAVLSEMKKGGLENIDTKKLTADKLMKRLFVTEYSDSQSAYAELEKVKKLAAGAFLLHESGKYALYAGSYDQQSRAESEVKRLSSQGLNITSKKVKVKMPATRISAGLIDKVKADEWIKRLRKLGVASAAKQVER